MSGERRRHSRFEVLTEGVPAWVDRTGTTFFYDGVSFWRHTRSGRRKLVPSWQSPPYGWMHGGDCTCSLCWPEPARQRQHAA